MAFAVFLGSNRDPGRGMLHPFLWALYSLHFGQLHPFSPYRVLRCFLAASSPLFMGVKFVRFWPLHGFLWLSDLSDLSRVPHGFTPDLCGFGAGSNRFVTASRVHQLGAFLVVRSLFALCSLVFFSGFARGSWGAILGSSPGVHGGQHQGAPGLVFGRSITRAGA